VRYEATDLTLLSGDSVLFCSDGLEDCINESGERLGDTRLQRFLARSSDEPAQSIADSLMALSENHAGRNAEIGDDRTVVVLKVS
jgi:serine phosphatase RsbU (regulator of sigma subunit)